MEKKFLFVETWNMFSLYSIVRHCWSSLNPDTGLRQTDTCLPRVTCLFGKASLPQGAQKLNETVWSFLLLNGTYFFSLPFFSKIYFSHWHPNLYILSKKDRFWAVGDEVERISVKTLYTCVERVIWFIECKKAVNQASSEGSAVYYITRSHFTLLKIVNRTMSL